MDSLLFLMKQSLLFLMKKQSNSFFLRQHFQGGEMQYQFGATGVAILWLLALRRQHGALKNIVAFLSTEWC